MHFTSSLWSGVILEFWAAGSDAAECQESYQNDSIVLNKDMMQWTNAIVLFRRDIKMSSNNSQVLEYYYSFPNF